MPYNSMKRTRGSNDYFLCNYAKRQDGKVYTDLHKTNQIIYLNYEDASCDLNKKDHFKKYYHIVKMIATLDEEK